MQIHPICPEYPLLQSDLVESYNVSRIHCTTLQGAEAKLLHHCLLQSIHICYLNKLSIELILLINEEHILEQLYLHAKH